MLGRKNQWGSLPVNSFAFALNHAILGQPTVPEVRVHAFQPACIAGAPEEHAASGSSVAAYLELGLLVWTDLLAVAPAAACSFSPVHAVASCSLYPSLAHRVCTCHRGTGSGGAAGAWSGGTSKHGNHHSCSGTGVTKAHAHSGKLHDTRTQTLAVCT